MNPFKALLEARNRNIARRSGQTGGNSASGPNVNPTTGAVNAKPSGDHLATRISKKPLYIAMGVFGLAAYGGYFYFEHHNPFDHPVAKPTTKIELATASDMQPPASHKPRSHKPPMPGAEGVHQTGTPATAPVKSVPAGSVPKRTHGPHRMRHSRRALARVAAGQAGSDCHGITPAYAGSTFSNGFEVVPS